MRDRGPIVILLAVLAFFGIKAIPASSPLSMLQLKKEVLSADRSGHAETAEAATAVPSDSNFWEPLEEFYDAGSGGREHKRPRDWPGFPHVPGWDLRFLLALVPDPVESSSGYRFDSVVDSIQRAVETQGYVLDRYFYPWRRKANGNRM